MAKKGWRLISETAIYERDLYSRISYLPMVRVCVFPFSLFASE
jgi:hypothetical protein